MPTYFLLIVYYYFLIVLFSGLLWKGHNLFSLAIEVLVFEIC